MYSTRVASKVLLQRSASSGRTGAREGVPCHRAREKVSATIVLLAWLYARPDHGLSNSK